MRHRLLNIRTPTFAGMVVLIIFPLLTSAPLDSAERDAKPPSLEDRLGRLERRLSSNTLLRMLTEIGQMKSEIRQLRGNIEEMRYEMSGIKKRQRDLYLDLDRRLLQLEGGEIEGQAESATANEQANNKTGIIPPSTSKSNLPGGGVAERDAYQKAYETLRNGEYESSINQFKSFLANYPESDYADNAQYWLAETYYVTRDFGAAKKGFADIVKNHPGSPKAADALLKTGFIEYEKTRWAEARAILNEVVQQYPDSNAAGLARKRLARMSEEKR